MAGKTGDSIERVKAALEHREPDRVPLDIGGTRVTGIHERAYQEYRRALGLAPSSPEEKVRYQRLPKVEEDFRALLGVDLESVDPCTAKEESAVRQEPEGRSYVDRWGCEWFMPEGGHYFDLRTCPLADAETPEDVDRHPWPNEDSAAVLGNIQADAAATWGERGRAVVLGRTCPGIFEMPAILCGHEKAMMDLALNPGLSEAIMDRILELKLVYYRAAIERVLAAGIEHFIACESDDLGAQRGLLISPEMYRRMVKSRHAQLFSAIKRFSAGRAFVGLHCCGAISELLPDLIESGVEVLNPVQVSAAGMDTRELKRAFGDAIVFHGGGVDTQGTLVSGTAQDVRDEVRRRMDDLAPGGGFIFSPVHSIQHDVSSANFMAMVEAYREYVA